MTAHIHPFIDRHHYLYTHETLSFNLYADFDGLLQGSSKEREMRCVVAVSQLGSAARSDT